MYCKIEPLKAKSLHVFSITGNSDVTRLGKVADVSSRDTRFRPFSPSRVDVDGPKRGNGPHGNREMVFVASFRIAPAWILAQTA